MSQLFRAIIRSPLPLDMRPCHFPVSIVMDAEANEMVASTGGIIGNRVEEIDFFIRVFFPGSVKVDIWHIPQEQAGEYIDSAVDVGHFSEGVMRVLVPVSELIDVQRALVLAMINTDSFEYGECKKAAETVASRLHFSGGDDVYAAMFTAHMIDKLRLSNRAGWQNEEFSQENINARINVAVVEKDYVSAANYAMFGFWKRNPIWKP